VFLLAAFDRKHPMTKIIFYPLGNADCCLIKLSNGLQFVFDYADMNDPDDATDKRIPLGKQFKDDIGWPKCRKIPGEGPGEI
jgi:hypothetical protein